MPEYINAFDTSEKYMYYLLDVFENENKTIYYIIYDLSKNELKTCSGKQVNSLIQETGVEIKGLLKLEYGFRVLNYCKFPCISICKAPDYIKSTSKYNNSIVLDIPVYLDKVSTSITLSYKSLILHKEKHRWTISFNNIKCSNKSCYTNSDVYIYLSAIGEIIPYLGKKEKIDILLMFDCLDNIDMSRILKYTRENYNISVKIYVSNYMINLYLGDCNLNNFQLSLNTNPKLLHSNATIGYIDFTKVTNDIKNSFSFNIMETDSFVILCNKKTRNLIKFLQENCDCIYLGNALYKTLYEDIKKLKSKYILLKGNITNERFLVLVE